jgi:hypothetical protein
LPAGTSEATEQNVLNGAQAVERFERLELFIRYNPICSMGLRAGYMDDLNLADFKDWNEVKAMEPLKLLEHWLG